ncbi:MAG: F0F1 ATP synthase subunit gamma [Sulfurovum sp.]|nr:F0F1 ATP synthase subunit gamma [Sulfurovum sp.]
MASLKDIQRKIGSVKNTQKTTRAMKLVSSAKLNRTKELAEQSKVYAAKITEMIQDIASNISKHGESLDNIFFKEIKNPKTVDIIFVTADKGLCGGFNSQTIKRVNVLLEKYATEGVKVRLRAIGKKGISYFKFNNIEMLQEISDLSASPTYERAAEFISETVEDYIRGSTDKIIIVHNGYVNMITQEVREEQAVPVDASALTTDAVSTSELELEPDDDDTLLEALVKRYLEYVMYYALIDSLAAEHSARMQAMESATNNAKEMVDKLSVQYNKARQESITTELIEIISGVESMK